MDLAAYDVDPQRGFVPGVDPLTQMPAAYRIWDDVTGELPAFIMGGRFRDVLKAMPILDPSGLTPPEQDRALLLLTTFASVWVWGQRKPHLRIPSPIAVPLVALARAMDRVPMIAHAIVVLINWRRVDASKPIGVDNVDTLVNFLGGVDEKWFFLATLGVELTGAPILVDLVAALEAAERGDDQRLARLLTRIAAQMEKVTAAFLDIRRWCDPYVFFNRVRPFLASWPAPGVVYEGTDLGPVEIAGGSAAQSSLLQAIDAGLGIHHEHTVTKPFLDGMRLFMPPRHRQFVADLQAQSQVRDRAREAGASAALRSAYDACIAAMDDLRRKHIGLVGEYITKQAPPSDTAIGTGGTSFNDFLRESRLETVRAKVG